MKYLFLFIAFSFMACKKDVTEPQIDGTLIFYKTTDANWNLIINGTDHGAIPTLYVAPVCGLKSGLQVQLKPDTYTISYKNMDGYPSSNSREIKVDTASCTIYQMY
jgi:hypothetical protein